MAVWILNQPGTSHRCSSKGTWPGAWQQSRPVRSRYLRNNCRRRCILALASEDGVATSSALKLRVERQSYLPASREEAWAALQSLVPPEQWQDIAPVFAAVESICRAECHREGEELLKAYEAANSALEEISADEERPRQRKEEDDIIHEQGSGSSASSKLESTQESGISEAGSNGASHSGPSDSGVRGEGGDEDAVSGGGTMSRADAEHIQQDLVEGINAAVSTAKSVTAQVSTLVRRQGDESGKDGVAEERASSSGNGAGHGLAEDEDELVSESEVLTLASVDFESASRLEFDRSRRNRVSIRDAGDPQRADEDFMRALSALMYKAHFNPLSRRDEALARSLNADYVAQLFISPDTRRLDADLVQHALQGLQIPEEAEAMLVFKRGYGQVRRKGRMLVAKLDYLQYIAVRSVINNTTAQLRRAWRAVQGTNTQRKLLADKRVAEAHRDGSDEGSNEAEGTQSAGLHDESLWELAQRSARRAGKQLSEWGVLSPRFLLAGGGLFMTLSNWGFLPQVAVEPLGTFREAWRPDEPARLAPVHVERVSLRDALAARRGLSVQSVLGAIELVEPTFQELLVLYRHAPERDFLGPLRRKVLGPGKQEQQPRFRRRNPITMRVFRDIPLPTWKIVFPDKLLQFRPLDGLRADLLSVAGLAAFAAQAKYDSIILEVITLSSAVALAVRVILGYKRMYDRFEQMTNEMLATTTIAGQEGVIEFLATSAALQQFEQISLAYLMLKPDSPLNAEELSIAVESLLENEFQVKVCFSADEALTELQRLGLVHKHYDGYSAVSPISALRKLRLHWDAMLLPHDMVAE